jgi:hypothetical protein
LKERDSVVSFIRKKLRNGIEYHYLVESIRVGDKVRQRVLVYLGKFKTAAAAHRYWKKQAETATDAAGKKKAREMVSKLEPFL